MQIRHLGGLLLFMMLLMASQAAAATYTVNTVGDEEDVVPGDGICRTARGTCSLRAALQEAAESANPDTILFDIPGDGVHVIVPQSPLPASAFVTINALSQGGENYVGAPLIEIDGRKAGQYASGFQLYLNSTLIGVSSYGFGMHAVVLSESQIVASYIGVHADGSAAPGNRDTAVLLGTGSAIGCPTVQSADVCKLPVVVASQRRDAIEIVGSNVSIDGAYIGISADAQTPMPNQGTAIRIPALISGRVQNVSMGAAYPNIFAHNGGAALQIIDLGAGSPTGIQVQQSAMYQNARGAIVLGSDATGFPLNDLGDLDAGPNTRLNTPYLQSLELDAPRGVWILKGVSRAPYLDVYVADSEPGVAPVERGSRVLLKSFDLESENLATGTAHYNVPGIGEDDARAFEVEVPVLAHDTKLIALARDGQGNTSILSDAIAGLDLGADSDGDGLPDALEIAWGLDPYNKDSDGDSLNDKEEWGDGIFPRDTDNDGIIDALDPDDDGDGLPTRFEIETVGPFVDVDGDGLPAWRDTDSDGDGIPDALEYSITHATWDPSSGVQPPWNNVDSDGDGLCDTPLVTSEDCVGGEDWNANGVIDPGETDPYHPDTDGDGVCDGPKTTSLCSAPNDNCPLVPNPDQKDSVGDGVGDACRCDDQVCPAGWTQCWADLDGDGFTGTPILIEGQVNCDEQEYAGRPMSTETQGDCDDTDPRIHPDAIEVCDGKDNNCNGLVDSEDLHVANLDPGQTGAIDQIVYDDKDHDGCGMLGTDRYACALDDLGISTNTIDQDDTDGVCCGNGIKEAGETCDGDDIGDAVCPPGTYGRPVCHNNPDYAQGNGSCTIAANVGCIAYKTCYADLDGDGFTGTPRTVPSHRDCGSYATEGRPWTDTYGGDCNDNPNDRCAKLTYPGAPELCDGCRNNCTASSSQPDGADEAWFAQECELEPGEQVPACAEAGLVCGIHWQDGTPTFEQTCGIATSEASALYFEDADGDGCGNPSVSKVVCEGEDAGEGWVRNAYDLDDTDGICCGNGIVDLGEECDGGTITCAQLGFASEEIATCAAHCAWDISVCDNALCGNGVIDVTAGETCDPLLEDAPENCRTNCTYCGDGVIQDSAGETCELDDPDCRPSTCTFCGDGVVQRDDGEECEPRGDEDVACAYGEKSCTYCDSNCRVVQGEASYCGDGIIDEDAGEACDGEKGCGSDCQWEDKRPKPQGADDAGCQCNAEGNTGWPWMLTCMVGGLLLHLRRRRTYGPKSS